MQENISPLVSVIIPLYNAEKYIKQSIDSILDQTYKNIEIIVIDDGSSDRSEDIVRSINSDKIRFLKNEQNLGVSATRNKGIEIARGKYIALMDADDISECTRIEKQVRFLEKNSDFGLVSSHFESFREYLVGTKKRVRKLPIDPEMIHANLLFSNAVCCPATMIRKDVLNKYQLQFDTSLRMAEDFDLWRRLSFVTKIGNIDEPLLCYRKHKSNSIKNRKALDRDFTKVVIRSFEHFGLNINDLFDEDYRLKDVKSFKKLYQFLEDILAENEHKKSYNQEYLKRSIIVLLQWVFKKHLNLFKCELYHAYMQLPLCRQIKVTYKDQIKYFAWGCFMLSKKTMQAGSIE